MVCPVTSYAQTKLLKGSTCKNVWLQILYKSWEVMTFILALSTNICGSTEIEVKTESRLLSNFIKHENDFMFQLFFSFLSFSPPVKFQKFLWQS